MSVYIDVPVYIDIPVYKGYVSLCIYAGLYGYASLSKCVSMYNVPVYINIPANIDMPVYINVRVYKNNVPDEDADSTTSLSLEAAATALCPRSFAIGDLVWGPVRGFSSWPGKLVCENEVRGNPKTEEGKVSFN